MARDKQLDFFAIALIEEARELFSRLDAIPTLERIAAINAIRRELHNHSPLRAEPVDCVEWIPLEDVFANDYNPNAVAPPEMKLLEHSISEDGYTQPIVAWRNGDKYEVVDGFHRNRVGRESKAVKSRILGHLPLTIINDWRLDRSDRIAATIRHNRARGKHKVEAMSDIVVELKRRNWATERICKELGMDEDEVLRLCQITGLTELFQDQDFSRAWVAEGQISEVDFKELSDDEETILDGVEVRTANTSDPNRIFHRYEEWECYKAGFYATSMNGHSKQECESLYAEFLKDEARFSDALGHVIAEWKNSCEHYLTNKAMNRIAWLGQASACYSCGLPSVYRGGYYLLTDEQQQRADNLALEYLNKWLIANGLEEVDLDTARSGERQSDIY